MRLRSAASPFAAARLRRAPRASSGPLASPSFARVRPRSVAARASFSRPVARFAAPPLRAALRGRARFCGPCALGLALVFFWCPSSARARPAPRSVSRPPHCPLAPRFGPCALGLAAVRGPRARASARRQRGFWLLAAAALRRASARSRPGAALRFALGPWPGRRASGPLVLRGLPPPGPCMARRSPPPRQGARAMPLRGVRVPLGEKQDSLRSPAPTGRGRGLAPLAPQQLAVPSAPPTTTDCAPKKRGPTAPAAIATQPPDGATPCQRKLQTRHRSPKGIARIGCRIAAEVTPQGDPEGRHPPPLPSCHRRGNPTPSEETKHTAAPREGDRTRNTPPSAAPARTRETSATPPSSSALTMPPTKKRATW